ncbi:unnamed protein product [Urochloa humidicola]
MKCLHFLIPQVDSSIFTKWFDCVQAYVENLEKEVRRLVDENLKLKKQCKELKREVAALVLPTKSSLRRNSSTQF